MGFNQILSTHQDSRTFSQIRARKMKATIAAALIGIFLLAGVSDIFAKPGWGSYAPPCECINPFTGTANAWKGNPDTLCGRGGPGFCYVDCNGACRDQQPTASPYRCQSEAACDVHCGDALTEPVCTASACQDVCKRTNPVCDC